MAIALPYVEHQLQDLADPVEMERRTRPPAPPVITAHLKSSVDIVETQLRVKERVERSSGRKAACYIYTSALE